jgi:O-Antigen ligase
MHSSNLGFQSIAPRLPLILTTIGALIGTLLVGAAIGQGEFIQVYLLLFALAGLAVVLALGSKYWLLIPIAFSLNLPAIPFGGRAFELPELAILGCTLVFACRYALSPRGSILFRPAHAGVLLYSAWAGIIFMLHPIGLSVMGSALGGARFYFKIALALASFLIVANQKISERDTKWIIRLLLVGSIVSMAVNIAKYKLYGTIYADPNADTQEYYTWHQEMTLPAMWIMTWLVARYKTKEIVNFGKPWTLFLAILCLVLAAISGKRAGFASVLLAPLIAAMLRKEYFYVLCGSILAAVLISLLTFGQGELFKLPLQAQRSLSYLPGKWDWEVRGQFANGIDPFRTEMRELAWDNIRKRPLVGQGYAINMNEMWGIAGRGDLHMFTLLTLALGSSWHNTWLGIWADFGFPAVLFWAIFWAQAVIIGFWVYRRTLHGSPGRTLTLMLLLWFIILICRSWTSGHSAENAFSTWWMFGVLVSLKYSLHGRQPSVQERMTNARPAEFATL